MKLRVPQCPSCETLLVPIKYKMDGLVIVILVCIAIVLATIAQFLDERFSIYLLAVFVILSVAIAGWYFISGHGKKPKWRVFLNPEDSSTEELDPQLLGLRNFQNQMFAKPKSRSQFNRKEFFQNFIIYSIGISAVAVIFLFPRVESISICLYAVAWVFLAVLLAETINGHFDMGQYWSGGLQIGILGVFAIVAYYLYPVVFET